MKTTMCKISQVDKVVGNVGTFLVLFIFNRMHCRGWVELTLEPNESAESLLGLELELPLDGIKPLSGNSMKVANVEQVQLFDAEF